MKNRKFTIKERILGGIFCFFILGPMLIGGSLWCFYSVIELFSFPDKFFYYRGMIFLALSLPSYLACMILFIYPPLLGREPYKKTYKILTTLVAYLFFLAVAGGIIGGIAFNWYFTQKQGYIICHRGNPMWGTEYAKAEKYCTYHFKPRPWVKKLLDQEN